MARKRLPKNEVHEFYFKERNDAQRAAWEMYQENDVSFFLGPAGTGKTHVAVHCGMADMLAQIKLRRVDRIVITRPTVEAGEHLGFLPGEVDEKVHPYMLPIYDCVSKMVHHSEDFIEDNFEIAPLAYMRGRTFEHCVAILDEAQNCTRAQLTLFLSRLGTGGKLIITGDPDQSDIGKKSGLNWAVQRLTGESGIGIFRFREEHIVRHPLVGRILKRLKG
jgi:phosphate starvation-inducible PhoH-like protein